MLICGLATNADRGGWWSPAFPVVHVVHASKPVTPGGFDGFPVAEVTVRFAAP
jgi:hypothetical protein